MLPVVVAVGIFALAVAALWPNKASADNKRNKELKPPSEGGVPSDTKKAVADAIKNAKDVAVLPPIIPPPKTYPDEPSGHVIQVKPAAVIKKNVPKIDPKSLTKEEKQVFIDQSRPLVEDGRATKETIDLYNKYKAELGV